MRAAARLPRRRARENPARPAAPPAAGGRCPAAAPPAEAEPSARPLRVQEGIALIRALEDVATWNENVRTIVGNGKHRLQIGDILDRGSKKQPELGVIIRVAKPTDDGTLFAPAILWGGKDTIDETAEYASKLAKWRKQYTNWHKVSARPLQLDEDAILEAIKTACVRPFILVLRQLPRRTGLLKRCSSDSWGYASVPWAGRLFTAAAPSSLMRRCAASAPAVCARDASH
eukprot:COSAG02_NODE_6083_length_3814_cov_6.730283_2_plen_230_part_00